MGWQDDSQQREVQDDLETPSHEHEDLGSAVTKDLKGCYSKEAHHNHILEALCAVHETSCRVVSELLVDLGLDQLGIGAQPGPVTAYKGLIQDYYQVVLCLALANHQRVLEADL